VKYDARRSIFDEIRGACTGTQRIVSVNYLFGRPLFPLIFLLRIVTLNVRDMRSLVGVVYGLLKNVVLDTEKRSAVLERR